MQQSLPRILVIGAGIGGLTAALDLATRGFDVTVLEKAPTPGGKMRQILVDGASIDAGPTVLTMRWIFEEIFHDAGTSLEAHVGLQPAHTLARHAWSETERLDLHADLEQTIDAIGVFAGAREAAGYRAFAARAGEMFRTLDKPFIRAQRPRLDQLVSSFGLFGLGSLRRISPFNILWAALGEHFHDPRLRQLFGRYATYCGSSPFLAPATLMLVAHVEREGVWLVDGGMYALATAIARLAATKGVTFRYGSTVTEIVRDRSAIAGVTLDTGERLPGEAIVLNADVGALTSGLFGGALTDAAPKSAKPIARFRPSPSRSALRRRASRWHATTSSSRATTLASSTTSSATTARRRNRPSMSAHKIVEDKIVAPTTTTTGPNACSASSTRRRAATPETLRPRRSRDARARCTTC